MQNNRDFGIIILFFLASLTLLFELVTAAIAPAWVSIYTNISYLLGFLLVFAYVLGHNSNVFDYNFFGEDKSPIESANRFYTGIVIAIIIGIALVSYVFTQNYSFVNFNLLPQLSQTFAVSNSASLAQTLIVIGFVAPLLEELLFRGILQPTLKKWIQKPFGLVLVLSFFGLIIMFLFNAYIIGFVFIAFAVALAMFKDLREKVIGKLWHVTFLAVLIQGVLFGAYHLKAYSTLVNPQADLLGAIAFGMIMGYIDEFLGSIVPSILIHAINNITVLIITYSISLIYGVFVFAGLVFLLYAAHRFGNNATGLVFKPRKIINVG